MEQRAETTGKDPVTPWHSQPAEAVREAFQTSEQGLSSDEARRRLEHHGPNRLPRPRQRGPWARFLAQFHNVLIYVLLAAAAVTGLLQHWTDTAVILGVVVVNALIGFIQEGKAEQALDAIRNLLSERATVLRDDRRVEVPAEEVVPGDLVVIQAGDKVPADLRVL
ncbi:MAG TPA: cation-transporting P-type ATPase, partial [Gammaproteobacteria bacterium]|nr:cation-transporting P-type ATPase [Gammaproteobacteria bacterium]